MLEPAGVRQAGQEREEGQLESNKLGLVCMLCRGQTGSGQAPQNGRHCERRYCHRRLDAPHQAVALVHCRWLQQWLSHCCHCRRRSTVGDDGRNDGSPGHILLVQPAVPRSMRCLPG